MEQHKINVSERIRQIIKEKGYTQKAIAARAGFDANKFHGLLHGHLIIRAEYLPRIAKALGVSINEFFRVRK